MPLVDPDDENQKIIYLPDTNLSPRPSSPVSPKATPNTFTVKWMKKKKFVKKLLKRYKILIGNPMLVISIISEPFYIKNK